MAAWGTNQIITNHAIKKPGTEAEEHICYSENWERKKSSMALEYNT